MTSDESRKAVIAAWEIFASRDQARIGDLFTVNAEWRAPEGNATALALQGPSRMAGREAIAAFLATGFRRLFARDVSIELRGVHADGDTVVVEERMTATLADGRLYDNEYCFVFELRAGRIHRVREYMDTLRGLRQIFG